MFALLTDPNFESYISSYLQNGLKFSTFKTSPPNVKNFINNNDLQGFKKEKNKWEEDIVFWNCQLVAKVIDIRKEDWTLILQQAFSALTIKELRYTDSPLRDKSDILQKVEQAAGGLASTAGKILAFQDITSYIAIEAEMMWAIVPRMMSLWRYTLIS